jgi:hypothetical protein
MKFISPKVHGFIDYLVVVVLLASPSVFGFTGLVANFTYALGAIHFALTLLTNFNAGLLKVIPFPLHGVIECLVGIILIVLAYTLFKDDTDGKLFYIVFGTVVLLTWACTDYKNEHAVLA